MSADDDWYHLEILEHIRMAASLRIGLLLGPDGVHGYHAGPFHVGRVLARQLDDARAVCGPIKTNNYAISVALGRYVPAILSHSSAGRYLASERPVHQSLGRPLSLVNRHPASFTVWRNTRTRAAHVHPD